MRKQIFKFQRPITTDDPSEPVLVYNKDRSIMNQLSVPEDMMEVLFPNSELKTYWLCKPHKDGMLELLEWELEQDW